MDSYPNKFFARNVQSDINLNRLRKIEDELKIIRNKIVDSFQTSVSYHSEVHHDLLPDLSEDEQKSFYCMIKDELSQRGFTVRGKCGDGQLHLVIFTNEPRTTELDRVLRKKPEAMSTSTRSRSSSVDAHTDRRRTGVTSAIPKLPGAAVSLKPASQQVSKNRSASLQGRRNSLQNSVLQGSSSLSSLSSISSTKSKIPILQQHALAKRPLSQPSTPSNFRKTQTTKYRQEPQKTPASKATMLEVGLSSHTMATTTPVVVDSSPSTAAVTITATAPVVVDSSPSTAAVTTTATAPVVVDSLPSTTPVDSNLSCQTELNMDFIFDRLKKANEKKHGGNKVHV